MLNLIPTPRNIQMSGERVTLAPHCSAPECFANAAVTLRDFSMRTHSIKIFEGKGAIDFELDETLESESYRIEVSASGAKVFAADILGAQNAAVSLVQLMEKQGESLTLPAGTLTDAPECSWRGILVDLARNWHDISVVREYIDACRFFKVKYLHLHFTDDQSYTLPSKAFPKLSTEGRCYTEDEIRGLISYAKLRGVEIIPEVDAPGHTACFGSAYGEIFGKNGIICQSDESMKGMETIYRELCELFADSEYIHIGGDEAYNIPKWTTCSKCLEVYRRAGIDLDAMEQREREEFMYATFLRRICEIILDCGKAPVMWEGFSKEVNHIIPREAVVMSWENLYQTTPDLLEAGFRLVNCSWVPMYVLAPDKYWSPREIYDWNVYYWKPCHPRSPYINSSITVAPTKQIEGGELLAWGDHVIWSYPDDVEAGIRHEQRLMEERIPCLAENTWSREKNCRLEEFFAAYTKVNALYAKFKKN